MNTYDDSKRNEYSPQMQYKSEKDGLMRKEQLPFHIKSKSISKVILTIAKVELCNNEWVDPISKKRTVKTQFVITFKERYSYKIKKNRDGNITELDEVWTLPLALNKTNVDTLLSITDSSSEEDTVGKKITIFYDKNVKVGTKTVGGIRMEKVSQSNTQQDNSNIMPNNNMLCLSQEQTNIILDLISKQNTVDIDKILNAYNVASLHNIQSKDFDKICNRITMYIVAPVVDANGEAMLSQQTKTAEQIQQEIDDKNEAEIEKNNRQEQNLIV